MIQPTTRKLSKRKMEAAVDQNGVPFAYRYLDEEFYQVPRMPGIFVSQYARVISTREGAPKLLTPYFDRNTGYTTIVLMRGRKGSRERQCHALHRLVAEVWCEKPNYLPGEKMDVHHMIKVKKQRKNKLQPVEVNYAENLVWVYRCYHKILDTFRSYTIELRDGRRFRVSDVKAIADAYGVCENDVYKLLRGTPTVVIDGKREIYCNDVLAIDGTIQHIHVDARKYTDQAKNKNTTK